MSDDNIAKQFFCLLFRFESMAMTNLKRDADAEILKDNSINIAILNEKTKDLKTETKDFRAEVKSGMDEFRKANMKDFRSDMLDFRAEVILGINDLRAEMKADMKDLGEEIKEL